MEAMFILLDSIKCTESNANSHLTVRKMAADRSRQGYVRETFKTMPCQMALRT